MLFRKTGIAALFTVAALAASPLATAQSMRDTGWYVGASIGQSEVDIDCEGVSNCDTKDTAWKIFGGYQINRNFAVELGYTDLGEASFSEPGIFTENVESTAWELVGIGSFPIANRFSLFGKAGLYRAETKDDFSIFGTSGSVKETNTDLTFGFGVRYDFTTNLALRAEWQRYSDVGGGELEEDDVDVLSIGVVVRF